MTVGFVAAALRYWLVVFPQVTRELCGLRRRALLIPDRRLRAIALDALEKRDNIEGAVAFAAFVPWRQRAVAVRALTAFQSAYNYTDLLAEQPICDTVDRGRRLHESLRLALDFDASSAACDSSHLRDGGYMAEMVQRCRDSVDALPSYAAVEALALRMVARLVEFQSLSHGKPGDFERWACALSSGENRLEWWEAAAAAGSSLGIYALIAAASSPSIPSAHVAAIESAYSTSVGALHSLLDSVVDEVEDAATGQFSLINCYSSPQAAAARMGWLAERALEAVRRLPDGRRHAILVVAMTCNYLSAPEALRPSAREVSHGVRAAIGGLAASSLLIFRMRRRISRLTGASSRAARRPRSAVGRRAERERVDAGAA